jgi:histone H3/H4
MTDNEIIKALECCSSGSYGCENGCPLDKECDSPINGSEKIMKSALDLINRQKAEIERLTPECEECAGCNQWKCDCFNERAEAIKEFAERLNKEAFVISRIHKRPYFAVTCEDIDNIKKEMTERKEDGK